MEGLTKFECDALLLVAAAAVEIRTLCRSLPESDVHAKILALADGMHNIPSILAGPVSERQDNADVVGWGVQALRTALGTDKVFG